MIFDKRGTLGEWETDLGAKSIELFYGLEDEEEGRGGGEHCKIKLLYYGKQKKPLP